MGPKLNHDPSPMFFFHKDPTSSIGVMLLTNREISGHEFSTTMMEVIRSFASYVPRISTGLIKVGELLQ